MRILALSDRVVDVVYSPQVRERFGRVDLLLACGDLPYSYLEYVVTMLSTPAFYVRGNHDQPEYTSGGSVLTAPGGWVNLDGRTVRVGSLLLAGLEGSFRYKPNSPYQYSEAEMQGKIFRLLPALGLNRLRYGRSLDILIAHAPPRGIHDGADLAHRGFDAFIKLMDYVHPGYLLHGHKHIYQPQASRTIYGSTTVINVYPATVVDWSEP